MPTGEWVRCDYRSGKAVAVQNRFGMRVVCKECARWIDVRDARSERNQWLQLAAALAALLLIVLLAA